MSTVSADVSTLNKSKDPYSVSASLSEDGGKVTTTTTNVTGDRTTGLFANADKSLGKEDFLKLLTTQMQYQDPLSPMDNTQMVAQLAQFSALEGNTNIQKAIESLNDAFKSSVNAQTYSAQSITNTSAVSMIGKTVTMHQTSVSWYASAGQTIPLQIHLGDNDSATVDILDSDGNIVKTLKAKNKDDENSASVVWDGTKDSGEYAPSGQYTVAVEGEDKDSSLYAFVKGTVDGVNFSSSGALLKIGGQEISIGDVLDVSTGSSGGDADSLSASTAVSLLGKEIRVRQDTVTYHQKDDETVTAKINAGGRSKVQVELTDKSGNVFYSDTLIADSDGTATLQWDGQLTSGSFAPAGTYTIHIAGEDKDPSLYGFIEGKVDGVSNLGGNAGLRIGSTSVKLSDIIDISDPSSNEGEAI